MTEPSASALLDTPLCRLGAVQETEEFAGARTGSFFTDPSEELQALHQRAGVYDLGWRSRFRITGDDRVRWLNGMVTNTVKGLATGQLNYTFLLNAQGRIQGDGTVYALENELLFSTNQAQLAKVTEQLDRFIIMDDVELHPEPAVTALGLRGPEAQALVSRLGWPAEIAPGTFVEHDGLLLASEADHTYEIWCPEDQVLALWEQVQAAGAVPAGIRAIEAFRILSGVPRYGADIHDKSLAQETGQTRALNFNKGCYLGQEIVERIRSRATVHRGIRVFLLQGEIPAGGTSLFAATKPEAPLGELTSITPLSLASVPGIYALGTVRTEAVDGVLHYPGGTATALARAPLPQA